MNPAVRASVLEGASVLGKDESRGMLKAKFSDGGDDTKSIIAQSDERHRIMWALVKKSTFYGLKRLRGRYVEAFSEF